MRGLYAFLLASLVITSLALSWAVASTAGDTDNDTFSSDDELYFGTDPLYSCPQLLGNHDAWPPDFNQDRSVNIFDVFAYSGKIGLQVNGDPALQRIDLDRDGVITQEGDIETVWIAFNGQTCTDTG